MTQCQFNGVILVELLSLVDLTKHELVGNNILIEHLHGNTTII